MPREKARRIARGFEWGALALLAVDLVLYLIFVAPAGRMAASERARQQELAERIHEEKAVVAKLSQFKDAAPKVSEQLADFTEKHISPHREAYYRAARLMRELSDKSGLQLTGISYKLDPWHGEPFRRLSVQIQVAGPFDNLMKFVHDLDVANEFVVLESCSLQEHEGQGMGMSLIAGMYLEP